MNLFLHTSFLHVLWVDTSSLESILMSLRGIAAQVSGMSGSIEVESVLQWISHIQGEWLIVFDNVDSLSPVARFIPPGNRDNILVTSRNESLERVIAFQNLIEITEMEEQDVRKITIRTTRSLDLLVYSYGCITEWLN